MENNFIELLNKTFDIEITPEIKDKLCLWEKSFIEYNNHTNLMSKNDVSVLFNKHVFDCLSILNWKKFKTFKKVLDVGTGGGFPSVILAIFFQNIHIIANDSRIKKINFINEIKNTLNLDNLTVLYSRIEQVNPLNVDLIVSRAVGRIYDIYKLSKKHLKKNGSFLIYKSSYIEEIEEFKQKEKIKKNIEIIPYKLPLKENYDRNLIIIE